MAQAERALIGCMFIEPWAAQQAMLTVRQEDFWFKQHQDLFQALGTIYETHPSEKVDLIIVSNWLREVGHLEHVGGQAYIAECIDAATATDRVGHYARIVRGASLDRHITRAIIALNEHRNPETERAVADLILAKEGNAGRRLTDLREDTARLVEEILRDDVKVLKTGFTRLDAFLGGLEPGDLVTIGARTSGGKTALKVRLCLQMAMDANECLFLTTEMKERQIVARMLPQATRIPAFKFRSRTLTEPEKDRVRREGIENLSSLPIKMMGKSLLSIDDIRRAVVQARPAVVFVDYLQRCKMGKAERLSEGLYDFMRDLKSIAQDTGAVIFIGVQLDRERDRAPSQKPVLADFRGSSGIESESDIALLLWKPPEDYLRKQPDYIPPRDGHVRVECLIAKARNGASDVKVDLDFDLDLVKFAEASMNAETEERWS